MIYIKVKTEKQLLDSGWIMEDGSFIFPKINNENLDYPIIVPFMVEYLGRTVKVQRYKYDPFYRVELFKGERWVFSKEMVNFEDYKYYNILYEN